MKRDALYKVAAATWIGAGVIHGVHALNANEEAIRTEVTVDVLEAQRIGQVTDLQDYPDYKQEERNRSLLLMTMDLGIAACFGFAAAASASSTQRECE